MHKRLYEAANRFARDAGFHRVGATFARWAQPTTIASAGAAESRKRPASGGENNWGLPGMMEIAKIAFVLFGLALPVSAYAESLGGIEISAAEKQACAPDVMRLCAHMLPDANGVLSCMQSKRSQVSPACTRIARAHGL